MKTKNTIILLVLAIGIFGAIYLINSREEASMSSAAIPERALPAVTSGTVERISIEAPGEKPLTLALANDTWYTNVEQKYEADQGAVTAILGALDEPIKANVVSSSRDSFKDYEVDETSGTKVQVFEKGKDTPALEIIVGKDGPSAYSTYVREEGRDDVLNAQASLSMVFKRPDGWRNKAIFSFNGTNATRIEAAGTSTTFAVTREGDKWMMESPEKAEGNAARINSLANMLSNLRANDFEETSTAQNLASIGLEPPRQTVTVHYEDKSTSPAKSESAVLLIGNEAGKEGDWYAKRKDRSDVFTIGQHIANSLAPAATELQAEKPAPPSETPAAQASVSTESIPATPEQNSQETSSPAAVDQTSSAPELSQAPPADSPATTAVDTATSAP